MAPGRYQLGSFFLGLKVSQHTFHCIIIRVKFMRYDCFEYTKKMDYVPISTRFIHMPQNASPEEKSTNSTKNEENGSNGLLQ
jgi:hypothetical protein